MPLRSIADARIVVGPQVITRYNNYRAIPIQGGPAPGTSSGTALAAMAEVSAQDIAAPATAFEWTGTAYQEVAAAGQTGAILGLAVLFAFLFLVGALRELDDPGAGAAVGADRGAGRVCRHLDLAACRSIFTRRSGSSC